METGRLKRDEGLQTDLDTGRPSALVSLSHQVFAAGTVRGELFHLTCTDDGLERRKLGKFSSSITVLYSKSTHLVIGRSTGHVELWDGHKFSDKEFELGESVLAVYLSQSLLSQDLFTVYAIDERGEGKTTFIPHFSTNQAQKAWTAVFIDESSLFYCVDVPTLWHFGAPPESLSGHPPVRSVAVGNSGSERKELIWGGSHGKVWHHSWTNSFEQGTTHKLTLPSKLQSLSTIKSLLLVNDVQLLAADHQVLTLWLRTDDDDESSFEFQDGRRLGNDKKRITGLARVNDRRFAISFTDGKIMIYRIEHGSRH